MRSLVKWDDEERRLVTTREGGSLLVIGDYTCFREFVGSDNTALDSGRGLVPIPPRMLTADVRKYLDQTGAWSVPGATVTAYTTGGYHTITLPTSCSYVSILTINGGNGGNGGGTGGTGGTGGDSGAMTIGYWRRTQLPTTLYGYVGSGGAGGASASTGGIGTRTVVEPENSGYAGGATPPALVVAGSTLAFSHWARMALAYTAWTARSGIAGGVGAAPAATTPWSGSGPFLEGGCGGGGATGGSGFAGGGWKAIGSIPAIAGGTAPAGTGIAGIYGGGLDGFATSSSTPEYLAWAYGGTGGGGAPANTGGTGGAGAFGCGGGGGGAVPAGGVAGGTGGAGGGGLIVVATW